jgi:hypothetical protein
MSETVLLRHGHEVEIELKSFRLDISANSELKASVRKRIKKAGGRYTECRGYCRTRFINLPYNEDGKALADKITETCEPDGSQKKFTWVFEPGTGWLGWLSSAVKVQHASTLEDAVRKFWSSLEYRINKGYDGLKRVPRAEYEAKTAEEERAKKIEELEALANRLERDMEAARAELNTKEHSAAALAALLLDKARQLAAGEEHGQ